jgi:phosphoglucosamine mutase
LHTVSIRFGTDGVRGEAFSVLSEDVVRALGVAAAACLEGDTFLVGRDTRESGDRLQRAFAEGCASAGASIVDLGVVPTPAVAWLSQADELPAAMLSASHNPWQDNGIKLFAAGGRKLTDEQQDRIQAMLDSGVVPEPIEPSVAPGKIDRYLDAVVGSIGGRTFGGTKVVLDCANGAASSTAGRVFELLGADVTVLAAEPDGRNINAGVGSTHPDFLAEAVVEHGAAVGFAFDGDADRVVAVGSDGSVVDGDRFLAMGAIDRRDHGLLPDDTVVITVMANLGFRVAMNEQNITMVETPVGDRHVLEALDAGGYTFGGEQSGHIIHRDLATTGDGVLSAVQLLDAATRRGVDVGTWAQSVMTRYPQVLENVRIAEKLPNLGELMAPAVQAEEELLGDSGRVLIRESGTEPLIRVMVEASEADVAAASAERLVRHVGLMTTPPATD